MIWLGLIGLFAASLASATPWFTQDPRTLPEGKWRIEEHVIYAPFNDAVVDGDREPLGAVQDFSSLVLHTRIRYGVKDNLTVFMDVPWVFRRATGNDGITRENDDIGDIVLLAKGKYYENKERNSRRSWAVSLKLDTPPTVGLAAPLATGTGTTDLSLIHLWEKGAGDTTWYGSLGYTFTGDRPDLNRDPGDVVFANVAAEHKLGDSPWNFVWELNSRYEGEAWGAWETTGGATVSVTPGFQYTRPRPGGLLTLEAGVQIPVITTGDAPAIPDYTMYAGGYIIF